MVTASKNDARLFRNNVGMLETKDGRFVHFGLCVGSSDLIGFRSVTVTPEMVGKKLAVFTAVEAKSGRGRATEEQANFIQAVKIAGGLAGVARTETELLGILSM